jgi:hypothetical protein
MIFDELQRYSMIYDDFRKIKMCEAARASGAIPQRRDRQGTIGRRGEVSPGKSDLIRPKKLKINYLATDGHR